MFAISKGKYNKERLLHFSSKISKLVDLLLRSDPTKRPSADKILEVLSVKNSDREHRSAPRQEKDQDYRNLRSPQVQPLPRQNVHRFDHGRFHNMFDDPFFHDFNKLNLFNHGPDENKFIEAEKVEKEKHKYGRFGHALGQAQFQAQNEIDKIKKKVHQFTH